MPVGAFLQKPLCHVISSEALGGDRARALIPTIILVRSDITPAAHLNSITLPDVIQLCSTSGDVLIGHGGDSRDVLIGHAEKTGRRRPPPATRTCRRLSDAVVAVADPEQAEMRQH